MKILFVHSDFTERRLIKSLRTQRIFYNSCMVVLATIFNHIFPKEFSLFIVYLSFKSKKKFEKLNE